MFLHCDLSKIVRYWNDLPHVAFKNYIQTLKFLIFFQFTDFSVPYISKTDQVRNLKHTPKIVHIIMHM